MEEKNTRLQSFLGLPEEIRSEIYGEFLTLRHAIMLPLPDYEYVIKTTPHLRCTLPPAGSIDTTLFHVNRQISRGARYRLYSTNTFAFRNYYDTRIDALDFQRQTISQWFEDIGDNADAVRTIEIPFPASYNNQRAPLENGRRWDFRMLELGWNRWGVPGSVTTVIINLGYLKGWLQPAERMNDLSRAMNTMAAGISGNIVVVVVDHEDDGDGLYSESNGESNGNNTNGQLIQGLRGQITGFGWTIGIESDRWFEYIDELGDVNGGII